MTIVVLSPHRDDAAFSVSLAIGAWLNQGHKVVVLNCFSRSEFAPFADPAPDRSKESTDRVDRVTALRRSEDDNWQNQFSFGLKLLALDIDDAPLRLGIAVDEVCTCPLNPRDDTAAKIRSCLDGIAGDALALPLAIGGHVDHLTARRAAIDNLCSEIPCALYEDLPYAARPGAAEQIEQTALDLHAGVAPVVFRHKVGFESPRDRKLALARCYPTQIDDRVAGQIADFSVRYDGGERLWANAAWRASELASQDLRPSQRMR